ncbi:MAG: galactokinase [Bacteroidales bacterium]|nr:galactokinase [Bacteroidales bacterium]
MTDSKILKEHFRCRFGKEGVAYAAPGRINLIGEHTDYNGGFVFPGAVSQAIVAVVAPNGSRRVNAYAKDLDLEGSFSVDDDKGPEHLTFRYLYGVVREMMKLGVAVGGFDVVYGGDVPLGAGMSSSAALESCIAFALNDVFAAERIDGMTLARVGQATEHCYVGVKCGIMDQFASIHGRAGHLMRLDCRSGLFQYFPWHPEGYSLLLVNSCVKHELVGSPYNERRESCERVARLAGVETLRDCTWQKLDELAPHLSDADYRRARYVLGEADRVKAVSDALVRDDYDAVGQQMYLTHQGLSYDYEVSCPELDFLVDLAKRCGVAGSRMMGGGFGGCTINLLRDDLVGRFVEAAQREYRQKFGIECKIIPVEIGDGARKIS